MRIIKKRKKNNIKSTIGSFKKEGLQFRLKRQDRSAFHTQTGRELENLKLHVAVISIILVQVENAKVSRNKGKTSTDPLPG